jgi:hypothetical protein
MALDVQIGVGPGGIHIGASKEMMRSLTSRFSRRTLYGGPCLIVDRNSGLALDATTDPSHRKRPVLWTPHGLPCQQWRIVRSERGLYKIASERNGMVLATDQEAGDGSWVWLEKDRDRDDQLWRLMPAEDHTAFAIETRRSEHSLDATVSPNLSASAQER